MPQLEFYWKIVTYAGATYLVTPAVAAKIQQALARKERHIHISQSGKTKTVATSDIRLVDNTDIAITVEDERHMIESGEINLHNPTALTRIDEDGNEVVRWKWAKRHVSRKQWDESYGRDHFKLGNYYGTDRIWAAFKLPLREDRTLPDEVELCNEQEVLKLDQLAQTSPITQPF